MNSSRLSSAIENQEWGKDNVVWLSCRLLSKRFKTPMSRYFSLTTCLYSIFIIVVMVIYAISSLLLEVNWKSTLLRNAGGVLFSDVWVPFLRWSDVTTKELCLGSGRLRLLRESFSESCSILVRCVWMVKLHPSIGIFITQAQGFGFPDTYSILLQCVAHVIHNIALLLTVLKRYHKVAVGRNHGDSKPRSVLELSAQNALF